MKKVTSISGGMTSAYVAVNYPSDYNWFALVSTEDKKCAFKDDACAKYVKEKTGQDIVGTLEDDIIIYTMMDLEQYMGRSIDVVIGKQFEKIIKDKGGHLPNIWQRYCTTEMKLRPLFRKWREVCDDPVEMQIGFRANEQRRAKKMQERLNNDGLSEFKGVVGKHPNGNNKWKTMGWQKPVFPLIEDGIYKDQIVEFWKDKPVRFAPLNNCVGCFHRNPLLLRQMFDEHPEKMEWFASQERKENRGQWKREMTFDTIRNHKLQMTLDLNDWENDCDSGHCGL